MATKALVPTNKHEEELVRLGRKQARADAKAEQKEEKVQIIKAERNEARREVQALEDQIADGPGPGHKLAIGFSGTVGTGIGIAAQHFGLDKTSLPGPVKKGMIPVLGGVTGIVGVVVKGIAGDLLTGLGFGAATGSGAVSVVKKAVGIA